LFDRPKPAAGCSANGRRRIELSKKTPHPEIKYLITPTKEEYVDIFLYYSRFLTRKPMASSQLQATARV
jgi:hypothetical protein